MRPGIDRPGQRQCEMVPFAGFHPVGGRRGRNRLAVSRRKHAARLAVRPADSQMVSVEGVGIGRVDQAELAAPRELPEPADAQPVVAVFGRESGGEQVRILPLRHIGGLKRLLRHAVDEKRRRRGVLLPIISSFASHAVLPLFRFVEEHTTLSDSNLDGAPCRPPIIPVCGRTYHAV